MERRLLNSLSMRIPDFLSRRGRVIDLFLVLNGKHSVQRLQIVIGVIFISSIFDVFVASILLIFDHSLNTDVYVCA